MLVYYNISFETFSLKIPFPSFLSIEQNVSRDLTGI